MSEAQDTAVRPVTPDDAPAVVGLAVSSGLFTLEEADVVRTMMAKYFERGAAESHVCVVDEDEDGPVAVAYYQPALAADRTWYLTMIAVQADRQSHGHGAALLHYIEKQLEGDRQRLLLVETSGLAAYERTRAFYRRCGYDEEARVRDFYEAGDDMVLFRKAFS